VWATKNREPFVTTDIEGLVYRHLQRIASPLGIPMHEPRHPSPACGRGASLDRPLLRVVLGGEGATAAKPPLTGHALVTSVDHVHVRLLRAVPMHPDIGMLKEG
jgi:hypothetical protein